MPSIDPPRLRTLRLHVTLWGIRLLKSMYEMRNSHVLKLGRSVYRPVVTII